MALCLTNGNKNTQALAKAEELIVRYEPQVLVMEDSSAKGSRRASRIKTLNRQIKAVAGKRKIQVKFLSGIQICSLLLGNPKGIKQEMAEMLAAQFPGELASWLPPKRKLYDSEDARMDIFDAVALAVGFRMREGD